MGLLSPVLITRKFCAKMRLPESDVADAPDSINHHKLRSFLPQRVDSVWILRQQVPRGEEALGGRHGEVLEWVVERGLHGILECTWIVNGEGIALAVAPLVHVEPVDVVARDVPVAQEIDSPAVHAHG